MHQMLVVTLLLGRLQKERDLLQLQQPPSGPRKLVRALVNLQLLLLLRLLLLLAQAVQERLDTVLSG